ncbi:MAG: UvrD-helicase domain-containing protein, partial [Alphaproteobacteria bacterium]|nr:UvrD-helicase domain-containing protein [Alphaproteobacteria bacterium]
MSTNPKASQKQRAASDPHVTAWVNANAGSGKTHVLVDRVVRLMLDGVEPSRIMCLTFTKAAAAEMANRLFDRLSAWITLDDEALVDQLTALGQTAPDGASLERARQLFTRALETPGGLKIQTIHAFCERVLQLFPVEAGIVPHFAMLDDRAAGEMLEAARDKVLLAAQSGSDVELAAALSDVASRAQSDQFGKLLSQLLAMRADLGTVFVPEQGLLRANAALRSTFELGEHEQQADVRATLTIDRGEYERLAGALESGSKTDIERAS